MSLSERRVKFIGPLYECDAHSWFEEADDFEYLLDELGAMMDESVAEGGSPLDGIDKWVAREVRNAEKQGVRLSPELTSKWAMERGVYRIARGYDFCRPELRWLAASVIETIDSHSTAIAVARSHACLVIEPHDSLANEMAWEIDFPYTAFPIGDARTAVRFDEMVAATLNKMALLSKVCGVPEMSARLPHVAKISLTDWQGNVLRHVMVSWYQEDDDVDEVPVKEDAGDRGASS